MLQLNITGNGAEQEETEDITFSAAEFQEAISVLENKIDKLMDMNSKLLNYKMEETSYIRSAMQQMMDMMKAWTRKHYPDRDRSEEGRSEQDEQMKHDEEMAAQAMQKQQDEQ
eukprot:11310774-Heterocapsa_arctica.AAC.1